MNTAKAELTPAPFARSFATSLFAIWLTLLLLAQTAAGAEATAQREAETRTLKIGEPIERELAGGQQHSYQITLSRNQFLKVVIAQRGIDVAMVATDPSGKKIVEMNDLKSGLGLEFISIAAEFDGNYRLDVRSTEAWVAVGRYEIRIKELR